MGEIADMMLDGTLCQCCGTFLDDAPSGYPDTCIGCGGDDVPDDRAEAPRPRRRRDKQSKAPLARRTRSPYHVAARVLCGEEVPVSDLRGLARHALGHLSGGMRDDLLAIYARPAAEPAEG